jgi:hypothetical protein
MKTILYWLSGKLPCKIISDAGRPYLERYYLFTLFGVRFYLHRFVASDPDRGLHDHPWPWALSIILSGSYYEHRRGSLSERHWFNWITGDAFHRVILHKGQVWTLFAHRARRSKEWGFLRAYDPQTIVYIKHKPSAADAWWKIAPRGRDEDRRAPL